MSVGGFELCQSTIKLKGVTYCCGKLANHVDNTWTTQHVCHTEADVTTPSAPSPVEVIAICWGDVV